jgi:hypothetical protein
MVQKITRQEFLQNLCTVVAADPAIVGLLDYGSSSEGRADQWSDVDVALFIRDEALPDFSQRWKSWAASLGELLWAYLHEPGHPWAIYNGSPAPLRVDFALHPLSNAATILSWFTTPLSVEAMVLYDGSAGEIRGYVAELVGKSKQVAATPELYERLCGDFWDYLLMAYSKYQRGQEWVARFMYQIALESLLRLLRIETGDLSRLNSTAGGWNVLHTLAPTRQAQLKECVAGTDLASAFQAAALFGREVCAVVGATYGWETPQKLAEQVVELVS